MVPSDWEVKSPSELFKLFSGFAFKSSDAQESGAKWLKIANVGIGEIKWDADSFLPERFLVEHKKYLLTRGDIVVALTRPTLGNKLKVARLKRDSDISLLNQRVAKIVCEENVDSEFTFQILRSDQFAFRINVGLLGTDPPNLSVKVLEDFTIPVPPLPEQQKIAKILSTWDKAISTTEKLIENSKQQKKALMQQLLTGKKRLLEDSGKPFEGEWESLNLGDICHVNPKKPDRPNNGLVSFIPMDAVSEEARLNYQEIKAYDDVSKGFTSFVNRDCVVAKITPCFENGKGAFLDNLTNGIGFGSTEFHVLRAKKNISSEYVYYLTQTRQFRVKGELNMQGSAGQKRVTTDYLKLFKVKIPKVLEEQKKAAAVLNNADEEIELLAQQLTDLTQEKKALMQQLLTGKRRVTV